MAETRSSADEVRDRSESERSSHYRAAAKHSLPPIKTMEDDQRRSEGTSTCDRVTLRSEFAVCGAHEARGVTLSDDSNSLGVMAVSPTTAIVAAAAAAADVASRAASHSASLAAEGGAAAPRVSAANVAVVAARTAAGVATLAAAMVAARRRVVAEPVRRTVAGHKRRRASSSAAELKSFMPRLLSGVDESNKRFSPTAEGLILVVGGGRSGDACELCGRETHETLDCAEAYDVDGRPVRELDMPDLGFSDDEDL